MINETLLLNNPLKFTMQQKVFADGVCIPKSSLIFKHIRTETTRYPLFINSQKQADIVIYAQNNDEFRGKMASIKNISGYYIEEAIIEKGMVLKKFYYINGTMVEMNSVSMSEIPKWLNKVLTTISQSLHLEVFSVDIFVNWSSEKYYCIDINPASAFFNSDTARKEFVKNILL